MAKIYATPGVYIEEKSAFPNSAVPVPTAVPAFIGYTEKAILDKKNLNLTPLKIRSYGEFLNYFGGAPPMKYSIAENKQDPVGAYTLHRDKSSNFLLHASMKLFFANGGSDCYIVSVGTYAKATQGVVKDDLKKGLEPLLKEPEPTMLVIPDAMLLETEETMKETIEETVDGKKEKKEVKRTVKKGDCYDLQQAMNQHCGEIMKNRVSILDVWSDFDQMTGNEEWSKKLFEKDIENFRTNIGSNNLMWAAAYFPWVHTTVTGFGELSFMNITVESQPTLVSLLKKEVKEYLTAGAIDQNKATAIDAVIDEISTISKSPKTDEENAGEIKRVHQTLNTVSPMYKSIMKSLQEKVNLLPPSAAMAGIYSMVDNSVGVHQSPANISIGSVVKPAVNLTSDQQEDLNMPLSGKAVNAIRTFPGKGILVWGARTLDGNSQDWRYISVRRTVIFIEQSIKYAAEAYVFEPNTAATWTNLKALITNFLTNVWQGGALAGAVAEDAFSVDVGLGTTMTPVDILDGYMRVTVKVAVTRPAEFIVITFQQQMQKS